MSFEATRAGFGYESTGQGETNSWLTPPALVQRLGEFDLDPCTCPTQPWFLAKENYMLPEKDGLKEPWTGRVWCNPPYGNNVDQWVDRMSEHRNGLLLIFSRCETKAWEKVWATGDAFLFPFGRVYFLREDGSKAKSGTAPSALIAYGQNNVDILRNAGLQGAFFTRAEILGGTRVTKL